MKMVKIEDWALCYEDAPYTAPELRYACLTGKVYGHPRFLDGQVVRTGIVVGVEGRIVKTRRTEYELGSPSVEYMDWLMNKGLKYDREQPVKVIK